MLFNHFCMAVKLEFSIDYLFNLNKHFFNILTMMQNKSQLSLAHQGLYH